LAAGDEPKRVMGLLAFHAADRAADNPLGLAITRCAYLVIAAGGPGELYRDNVYPKHCFGALGLAHEVGVEAVNLTKVSSGSAHRAMDSCKRTAPGDPLPAEMVRAAIQGIASGLRDDGLDWREVAREVQARMSDDAGFMCSAERVRKALAGRAG
jgi:hypothetical protein